MKCLKPKSFLSRQALLVVIYSINVAVFGGCVSNHVADELKIIKGRVSISSEQLQNQKIFSLDGEWEFYWNRLYTPTELAVFPKEYDHDYTRLPSSWRGKYHRGESLDSFGYATYRLHLELPESTNYGLYFSRIETAYKIWVDGAVVLSVGRVGATSENTVPEYRFQPIPLQLKAGLHEIVVQVSNYQHVRGGIKESIRFGLFDAVISERQSSGSFSYAIVMLALLAAVYQLIYFSNRRSDLGAFYFALMSLSFAAYQLFLIENAITWFIPSSWEWQYVLITFSFLFVPYCYLRFIQFQLGNGVHSLFVERSVLVVSAIFAAIVLVASAGFYQKLIWIPYLLHFAIALYLLYRFYLKIVDGSKEQLLLALPFFIFVLSTLNDALYVHQLLETTRLISYGMLAFLVGHLIQTAQKSARIEREGVRARDLLKLKGEHLDRLLKQRDDYIETLTSKQLRRTHQIHATMDSLSSGKLGRISQNLRARFQKISSITELLYFDVEKARDYVLLKNAPYSPKMKPLDLKQLVDFALRLELYRVTDSSQTLNNQIQDGFPAVLGDEKALLKVLHYLLENAIDYSKKLVMVRAEVFEDWVKVLVIDSGRGIPIAERPFLFEPLEPGLDVDGPSTARTGVGLFNAKRLIESMGGEIDYTTIVNRGSTFHFTIPVAPHLDYIDAELKALRTAEPAEIHVADPPTSEFIHSQRAYSHRVLLIEDDPDAIHMITGFLSEGGYLYQTCHHGSSVLDRITEYRPQILLMDTVIPGATGLDLARQIRERYSARTLPIVMMGEFDNPYLIRDIYSAEISDFLRKPIVKEELFSRLTLLLKLSEVQKQLAADDEFRQETAKVDKLLTEILYVEARNGICYANLEDSRELPYPIEATLTRLEEHYAPQKLLIRTQKSFLANPKKIHKIARDREKQVDLVYLKGTDRTIRVGKQYVKALRSEFPYFFED